MEFFTDCDNSSPNFQDEEVRLASSCPKNRTGRKKYQETRHPVFRGTRLKKSGKWVSEMREPNKKSRIWLGTFTTAEMAARAHDVAALALRGRSACLNFADSAWRLPVPASSDPKDIQRAALEAGESFRPVELDEDWEDEKGDENSEAGTSGNLGDDTKPAEVGTSGVSGEAFYMDEEALFGMPGLIVDMAKGMMLSPPRCEYGRDDVEWENSDVSLWSF